MATAACSARRRNRASSRSPNGRTARSATSISPSTRSRIRMGTMRTEGPRTAWPVTTTSPGSPPRTVAGRVAEFRDGRAPWQREKHFIRPRRTIGGGGDRRRLPRYLPRRVGLAAVVVTGLPALVLVGAAADRAAERLGKVTQGRRLGAAHHMRQLQVAELLQERVQLVAGAPVVGALAVAHTLRDLPQQRRQLGVLTTRQLEILHNLL